MAIDALAGTRPRMPLSRERVLDAAISLADHGGVEALSMRKLANQLGVVPMALYKHVANKDQLLDGMIDTVIAEIAPQPSDASWKSVVRRRVLAARRALLRHPWASQVIQSRINPTPAVLSYMDAVIGIFRAGGFSLDLTHHVLHAMGSRLFGFSQELEMFKGNGDTDQEPPQPQPQYPHLNEMAMSVRHDDAAVVGQGCDDQFEFEFALDLLLDGIQRLWEAEALSGSG